MNLPPFQQKVIDLLTNDSTLSMAMMALALGKSRGSVQHALDVLKAKGLVHREPARWVVTR